MRYPVRAAVAIAAVFILAGTAACSATGEAPQPTQADRTTTSGTSTSTSTEPSATMFSPKLVLEKQTFQHDSDQVIVRTESKSPIVTGVAPEHAKKFSDEFASLLKVDMLFVAEQMESYLPDPHLAQYCEDPIEGKCVNTVRVKVTQSQIYKDFASISYEFGMNILGGMPNTFARSLTMNLRTGQVARVEDFMEDPLERVEDNVSNGTCLASFAESRGDSRTVSAFSPTTEGLYLSWDAGSFDSNSCDIAHLTIPWDQDTGPSENQATRTDATSDPSSSAALCAGDPALPMDIDPRVCSTSVNKARALPKGQYGSALIVSPSENILCSFSTEDLDCIMMHPFQRIGLGNSGKASVPDRDDGPSGETPITLGYGEAATFGQFACVSQDVGMSCWNTQTKHGMFLSKTETLMW